MEEENFLNDEEVIAIGEGGTSEDQLFDQIIGIVEEFMVSLQMDQLMRSLPNMNTVENDHEKHMYHKRIVMECEEKLDARVHEQLPDLHFSTIVDLLHSRRDEIGEEVWEFVSSGCLEYPSFVALWAANSA